MTELTIPQDLLAFLKSLASETRLQIILVFLDGQERTVGEIVETVGLSQSTISEHLANMKHSGLMVSKRQGKEVYYQPDAKRIVEYLDILSDILGNCCK